MVEGVHYNKCGARRLACVGRKSCLYITQLPVYTKLKNSIFRRGVSGRCDGLTLWVMCSRASSTGATSWVHVGEYAKKVRLQVQQPPAVSRRPLLCDQTPQYLLLLTSTLFLRQQYHHVDPQANAGDPDLSAGITDPDDEGAVPEWASLAASLRYRYIVSDKSNLAWARCNPRDVSRSCLVAIWLCYRSLCSARSVRAVD